MTSSKLLLCLLKRSLKAQKKFEKLEIMYGNAVYILFGKVKFLIYSEKNADITRTQIVCVLYESYVFSFFFFFLFVDFP